MPYRCKSVTHADRLTLAAAAVIAVAMRWMQHLRRKRADRLPGVLTPLGFERHCADISREQRRLCSRPVGNAAVQEAI